MGNTPELQTTHWMPHGHLLVNVPITFPSSFLATDSQSCTAISAATFLALRKNRESVLLRRLCTSHISVKGRMESVCRIPTGSDYCPILLHSQGFLRGQTKTHHSSCGKNIPNHRCCPHQGPHNRAQGTATTPSHHRSRRTNQVILHLLQHRVHVPSGQALGTYQALQHAKHAPQATLLHTVEKQKSYTEVSK